MSNRLAGVVITRASIVIMLTDLLTGKEPHGLPLQIRLAGGARPPLKKSGGLYVFTDLPAGEYVIEVDSLAYVKAVRSVSVGNPRQTVEVSMALAPSTAYPFTNQTAVVRGMALTADGKAMANAVIHGYVLTEDCARARLAADFAGGKDREICLQEIHGSIVPGESVWIYPSKQEEKEVCRIINQQDKPRYYLLEQTLKNDYQRGDLLLSLIQSQTSTNGEFAVAFPGFRKSRFTVLLECHYTGKVHWTQEVKLAEGTVLSLGKIQAS